MIDRVDKLVEDYVEEKDWRILECANTDKCVSGLHRYVGSDALAKWMLTHIDPEVAKAHMEGVVHLHDLGYAIIPYCCGWDLGDLLIKSFGASAPARHFDTACEQIATFLRTSQNEFAGAQAVSDFSILLAPYVREDVKVGHYYRTGGAFEYVKQSVQKMVFMLNQKTRDYFQTPFTNVTLDLEIPEEYQDRYAIIGDHIQRYKYGELGKEMDIINKAFLEVLLEGNRRGVPHTFPIPTINILPNSQIFEESEVNDLLWKLTAKYGSPYFFNYWDSGISPLSSRSMCCRLRLDIRQVRRGGMWNMGVRTGSLAVATISLPALAVDAGDQKEFIRRTILWCDKTRDYLLWKKDLMHEYFEKRMYPMSKEFLGSFRTFFLTIGIVGLAEAYKMLGIEQKAETVAPFLKAIAARIASYSETTDWKLWNFEQTPAEGASHRLARHLKRSHPNAFVRGSGESVYITNSSHLPQGNDWNLLDEIEYRNQTDPLYTGGTLFNVFIGESLSPIGAKTLVHSIATKTKIPYISITPTYSFCQECDKYMPGVKDECDNCSSHNVEHYSRVVGYFRPVRSWNAGKKSEFQSRKYHDKKKGFALKV